MLSLATLANASVREFRVNNTTDSKMGYAIAWGVPGLSFDFEKLDLGTEDEINNFVETQNITNYVVDLKTNTILSHIKNDLKEFSIGTINYGNHFSLSLERLTIEGLTAVSYQIDAVAVVENYKWSNNLSSILLVDHSQLTLKVTELDGTTIENDIKAQIKNKISQSNQKIFNEGATTLTSIESVIINNYDEINKMNYTIEIPKSDGKLLFLEVLVKLTYTNGKLTTKVVSFKQKQE